MPKSFVLIIAGVLSLLAAAAWLASGASKAQPQPESAVSSGAIYAASFQDGSQKAQSLGQWQQKLLLINFWATWCAPCKEEMPVLSRLHRKYAANGLQVVGIAADSASNVANFSKSSPVSYPLLVDEARTIEFSKRLGNRLGLLPHTVVVAPGGQVIYVHLGQIVEADLEAIVAKSLPK